MTVSPETQAVLLLTAYFNKNDPRGAKPLAPKEWGRFANWLKQHSLRPDDLLRGNLHQLLGGLHDETVSIERLNALLDRGSALALSMEKWLRSGLWVMTRSDPDYPKRLKQRLGGDSPAVLFGCGNRGLMNKEALAVVGSRNAQDSDLAYSRALGALASAAGISIVSGGARGIDETAMIGALEAEGTAVGVLADSLLRACTGAKYRKHLLEKSLVLVSPFNPEARFNVGNAMQRNKYIYCLADAAMAVHSGKTGGTWTGAREDLRNGWVPLWVKSNDDPEAGNAELIAQGARPAPASIERLDVMSLFLPSAEQQGIGRDEVKTMPEAAETPCQSCESEKSSVVSNIGPGLPKRAAQETGQKHSGTGHDVEGATETFGDVSRISFYELFLSKTRELCVREPLTSAQITEMLRELKKSQIEQWLNKAVEEGLFEKLKRPIRYRAIPNRRLPLESR